MSFTETVHASSEVSERTFKSTRAPVPALAHELVTKSPEAERQVRGRRQRGRRHAEPRETLGHRSCVGGVEGVKHIGRVAMRESVDPMRAAWVRGAPRMQIVPDEGAIRGNQRQSEAIRGNQRQSEAINGRHASKSYHSPSKRNGNDSRAAPRLPCTSATLAAADPDAGAVAVGAAADAGSRMATTTSDEAEGFPTVTTSDEAEGFPTVATSAEAEGFQTVSAGSCLQSRADRLVLAVRGMRTDE